MKRYTFDIETYINYTLFALRDIKSKKLITFEIRGEHNTLTDNDIAKLTKLLTNNVIVTFNGIKFDEPITALALIGWSAQDIFGAVQELINEDKRHWELYRSTKTKKFIKHHIDIMDVARGSASLKLYGARLGTKKLQDLPYSPETILTEKQMDDVLNYCENDNILTNELFDYLDDDLSLREAMGRQYDIDFMSFKGAKIAELILVKECNYTGDTPDRPEAVRYKKPKYIKFKTPMLKALCDKMTTHTYQISDSGKVLMPDFLKDEYEFDNLGYKFGLGGLHGAVTQTTIIPKKDELIVDIDYKSLYPSIIIENDFSPQHIGSKFSSVYQKMYDKRNKELKPKMKTVEYGGEEYKSLDRQQNTMKLVLNSSFGQTGQRFSKIYDPNTMLNTTITGQLTLMMVIEKLARKGYHTYYANTDGITLLIKKKDLKHVQKITKKFDKKTGLEMEYNYFKYSHIRDVNNFVNITSDDSVKSKGAYGEPNLEKNAQVPIVFEAIRLFLKDGTPIKKTIKACKTPHDFCSSMQVNGGAMYAVDIPPMKPERWDASLLRNKRITKVMEAEKAKMEAIWVKDNGTYLGKVVRWYYSTKGNSIHRKASGNKVPMTDGCKPMMDLVKKLPKDLDIEWYIAYADRMLKDLGVIDE